MSEPKRGTGTVSETPPPPPPGTTTANEAARKHNEGIRAKNYRLMAKRYAGLHKLEPSKAKRRQRWIKLVESVRKTDPHFLDYLRKEAPQQVAEAERAIAAGKGPTPKVVPKPPAFKPRFGSPKLRAGVRFGAAAIASLIPDIILAVADREAAKEALRRIATKFLKEGFAKGVAAGVMEWNDEEVQLNLKYRVTHARVQDLHDPAGFLTRTGILQFAESCENYAVEEGFEYSSRQTLDWRQAMLKKGLSILAKRGVTKWRRTEDSAVLFEFEFIDKLAWVLRPTTDSIVEPAIRLS